MTTTSHTDNAASRRVITAAAAGQPWQTDGVMLCVSWCQQLAWSSSAARRR
jgi:hypothetical protein